MSKVHIDDIYGDSILWRGWVRAVRVSLRQRLRTTRERGIRGVGRSKGTGYSSVLILCRIFTFLGCFKFCLFVSDFSLDTRRRQFRGGGGGFRI